MKRFLIALFIALLLPLTAFGVEENEYREYISGYDLSVFKDELDKDTQSLLNELGFDAYDYSSISSLSMENVVNIIKNLAVGKLKSPIESMLSVLVFILLSSLFRSLKSEYDGELGEVYSTCTALIIAVVLVAEISPAVTLASSSIKLAGSFIYAFIPIFCAIVAASGGISTSFATNSMLLLLAQGLSFISANVFMPLINCFLSIGICSSLRAQLNLGRLINALRRGITTAISVICAVFISILSVKTNISSRADMLGIRSLRFVISSVVPVIGGSVSEGLLSIQGYSSLIKSSVGIVGVAAITLLFLPSVIEITIWRIVLSGCSLICDAFGDSSVSMVLSAFRDTALLINVVLVLSCVTSIISFGIFIAVRTAA